MTDPFSAGIAKGTVLVTGHTGFKGAWLTLLLHELGFDVVGLSLPPLPNSLYEVLEPTDRPGIEYFIDIRDRKSIQEALSKHDFRFAFHLAAQPLVLESYINPVETFETNVVGTANVLSELISQPTLQAIGVVTTDKVYKNSNDGTRFTEKDPLGGKDPYSASKVGTEAVADAWRQISNIQNGPRVISLRAGNVIGGGDYSNNRLLPDIVKGYLSQSPITIRNPESTRPWQHVLDPLIGYYLALIQSSENSYESFNFGPSEPSLTVKNVIQEAVLSWGSDIVVDIIGSETDQEAKSLELDSSQAKNILGWKPFLNQNEAVEYTIKWWKNHKLRNLPAGPLCRSEIERALSSYR